MSGRGRWRQDGVFEPDDLKLMGEAYEHVLAALSPDQGPHAAIPRDQCRALIADAILGGAQRGISDARRLEQRALKRLAGFTARATGHGLG